MCLADVKYSFGGLLNEVHILQFMQLLFMNPKSQFLSNLSSTVYVLIFVLLPKFEWDWDMPHTLENKTSHFLPHSANYLQKCFDVIVPLKNCFKSHFTKAR